MMYKKTFSVWILLISLALAGPKVYGIAGGGQIQQYTPEPYSDADWIYFSNGLKINIQEGAPLLSTSEQVEQSVYYLIHCQGPIYSDYKSQLESAGCRIYSYFANYTFLVRMDEDSRRAVEDLDFVDWVGIYQPAYKISGHPALKQQQGSIDVTILLYPDVDRNGVVEFLNGVGARITEQFVNRLDQIIICTVDLSHIREIARLEAVNWIEPYFKKELHNSNVQWILQTCTSNNRRIWDMGIRGEGQLCSTCDSGIRTSHYSFRSTASTWITTWGDYPTDRKIVAYKQSSGMAEFGDESINSYHGTHTGGTITGDDTLNATDPRDGVALKARIYFLDGGRSSSGGIYLPGDLTTLYNMPYTGNAAGSVKIMSNSWGSYDEGLYTTNARQSDQFMWDHPDFLLFFSNGNNPPGNYVGSPATAKNMVSVGSCGNSSSWGTFSSFSCHGPTNDGRLKPTILSPGSSVASASGASDNGYGYMSGTSMSSPGAAGAAVLVRQYFTEGWYPTGYKNAPDAFAPSAALIKAMLVNSADPSITSHTVPDSFVGWGRIDLDSALYFAGDTKNLSIVDDTAGLSTGNYVEYTYNVLSGVVPFRASLVWTDYPGNTGSGRTLVNDLHLTVTDPSMNQYKGNVYSSGQSTTGGIYDTINVEECVRINTPGAGTWTVRVDANNCPNGPQPFALVITADLPDLGVFDDLPGGLGTYHIYAPYPNPFKDQTCISFNASRVEPVKLYVYNTAGQLVRTVFDGACATGLNRIYWNGRDDKNGLLPDGIYFYFLQTNASKISGKLVIQH
jgi:hypothetical protein